MTTFLLFLSEKWYLFGALFMLAWLFFAHESRRSGATISVHQLATLVNRENALVIDLRDTKEFQEGHIVDAIHVPYAKLAEKLGELAQFNNRPLILVDKMGQHTGPAGKQLQAAGFVVHRLEGGMLEWRGSNLPVVKG